MSKNFKIPETFPNISAPEKSFRTKTQRVDLSECVYSAGTNMPGVWHTLRINYEHFRVKKFFSQQCVLNRLLTEKVIQQCATATACCGKSYSDNV